MTTDTANIPYQFPFVILALLLFISAILSTRSGWRRIAERFPYQTTTDHKKYYFARMSLGSGSFPSAYGGLVIVRLSKQGLGLSVIFLVRYLHSPIFLPWSAVSSCTREHAGRYYVTRVSIPDEESVFSFYGKVGEDIYALYVSENIQRKS